MAFCDHHYDKSACLILEPVTKSLTTKRPHTLEPTFSTMMETPKKRKGE